MHLPQAPRPPLEILRDVPQKRLLEIIGKGRPLTEGKYLHWDELRHRKPPQGLTADEWWFITKSARLTSREDLPLRQKDGTPFHLVYVAPLREGLHAIDQSLGRGTVPSTTPAGADTHGRTHFLVSSLMEEAIRSSQLEGASTTRAKAKEMIRTRRQPRDRGERMILNNYHAMERIEELAEKSLTPDVVFELHSVLADGTLDDPSKVGVFRASSDDVVVELFNSYDTAHVPPPASELPGRLDALVDFANGSSTADWMHPVLRAIVLHFMIGYDHPFVDGNGRVARALFYWAMVRHGYPQTKYLSISQILRKGPGKYQRGYLLTETDGGDLTYFALDQLDVITRSIGALETYVRGKLARTREVETKLRAMPGLNHRQLALLGHALRNPGHAYTVRSHEASHRVVTNTARSDLDELTGLGFLLKARQGRAYAYVAPGDLDARIDSTGSA